MNSLAVYTTIYPSVQPFLRDWYRSVLAQTDQNFCLWIGLDSLDVAAAKHAMGADLDATWVLASVGDSPAQVRQRVLERIVQAHDGVVLVDSDDVLHPSRVAAARSALQTSDLAGCALRIVDAQGQDLGLTFDLPNQCRPENVLPRNNAFGLSNSAFRSQLLARCLPIPRDVALVDWYLATRAWLGGARLTFDSTVRMDYRQHSANMARLREPFTQQQVIQDTELVRNHFRTLKGDTHVGGIAGRFADLEFVAADIETFHREVVLQPARLESYVAAINALKLAPLWWSCVANPALKVMWMPKE